LLHFREIGERASQQYISNHLLCQPSGSAKVRKKKLLTMSSQLPSFISVLQVQTPKQLYNSTNPLLTPQQRHDDFQYQMKVDGFRMMMVHIT
jgi:hypothetical protein